MSVKIFGATTILFFVCATALGWVVDDAGCRTPDLGVGECIPVRDCKVIMDFLQRVPQPIPSQITTKLRQYTCGFSAREIKVCCPDKLMPEMLAHMKMSDEFTEFEEHKSEGLDLLPKECGYTGIPNKISNGENARLREFPWMALLSYKMGNNETFQCGGTIINDRYILTAAHCLIHSNEAVLTGVRVGDYDISQEVDCELQPDGTTDCIKQPVQNLGIEKIIPHPNFTKSFSSVNDINDIGLLRVTPMKFTDNVQPICLPTEETKNAKPPKNAIVTGWGFVDQKKRSDVLQKVSLPLISQTECQRLYSGKVRISTKQICTNGNNKDNCNGDSGGPLHTPMYLNDDIRMVQYGVVSFGVRKCGSGEYPGVYTRVESYMDWISSNIKP